MKKRSLVLFSVLAAFLLVIFLGGCDDGTSTEESKIHPCCRRE